MTRGRTTRFIAALSVAISTTQVAGCVTDQRLFVGPPPYAVLPVDELMSCDAMTASFLFAAKRAARIEYWLEVGPLPGYGYDRFGIDGPRDLVTERQRMDALSDVQRLRGCPVLDPGPAVIFEKRKLEEAARDRSPPLRVKG